MLSQLFAGDELLAAIAAEGPQRISRTEHTTDPAVGKVQAALLIWDSGCLPAFGAVPAGTVPVVVTTVSGTSSPFPGFADFTYRT